MPRQRILHPDFFTDSALLALSPLARILFAGLWCHADREGRLEDNPLDLKIRILPVDNCDVNSLLNELSKAGRILRYSVDQLRCIVIHNFCKYQTPHIREAKSKIPSPEKANLFWASPGLPPIAPIGSEMTHQQIEPREIGSEMTHPQHVAQPPEITTSPEKANLFWESPEKVPGFSTSTSTKEESKDCEIKTAAAPLISRPSKRKPGRPKKETQPESTPDPRHRPLLEALMAIYEKERSSKYPWNLRVPRDVTNLLASGLETAEIEKAYGRALKNQGFPTVSTVSELVTHLAHFAGKNWSPKTNSTAGRATESAKDWSNVSYPTTPDGQIDLAAMGIGQ